MENMARPALPVEGELFKKVDCVGGSAKPKHEESGNMAGIIWYVEGGRSKCVTPPGPVS